MPCSFFAGGLRQRQLVFTWERAYCIFWKRREIGRKPGLFLLSHHGAERGGENGETAVWRRPSGGPFPGSLGRGEAGAAPGHGIPGDLDGSAVPAQVERAAKGDATAFRLLRDAMAEAAEEEEKERLLTQEDLKGLSDEELRALLERCREDGGA